MSKVRVFFSVLILGILLLVIMTASSAYAQAGAIVAFSDTFPNDSNVAYMRNIGFSNTSYTSAAGLPGAQLEDMFDPITSARVTGTPLDTSYWDQTLMTLPGDGHNITTDAAGTHVRFTRGNDTFGLGMGAGYERDLPSPSPATGSILYFV